MEKDFEERYRKYQSKIQKFCLMDDTFMNKVFEDKKCTELVLRIILDRDDLIVDHVNCQLDIKNLQGRSVILDSFCKTSDNQHCNIEVQKENDDDHIRRVRYNGSCITVNITNTGSKFKQVPDVCVIFISRSDIFKGNHPLYHVDSVIRETGEIINDGWKRVFLNTKVKDGSDVSRLMTIFTEDNAYDDQRFPCTSARKRLFKETPKGENEMSDIVREIVEIECAKAAEEAAQKATEEATKENSIKNIKLLIKNGVPLSTIVTTFSYIFSESDIQKIYSECESNTIS